MRETSSRPRPALLASCTTHIVQDGLSSTIFVLLPILAQAFGLSYAQVGLLKGLNNISQAAFEFGSGWLSEWIGEVRLIVVGLVLSCIGYLCISAATDVFSIAVILLIIGAGTGLHHAPASSLIANSYKSDNRTSALGIYNASGDVGKLVFTGGFSLAAGAGFAWYEISLIFGFITLIAAMVIAVIVRSFAHNENTTTPSDSASPQDAVRGWGILNWRSFNALLVVSSIDTLVQASTLVFVAFLMLSKGLPLVFATGATVILLAGGVFGKAGCGFLADKIGAHRAFIVVQILTAFGLAAIVIAPNWFALILLFPLGAVAQGSTSITYGFAANLIHPKKMARGYALLYSSGTLAAAIGPFAFGWIADTSGIDNAIYLMAFIILFSIPPMLILPGDK